MFRNPTTDLIVVLVIVLLIFGPKRLPSLGKQLGSGLREFKDSITGDSKDAEDADRPQIQQASARPGAASPVSPEPAEANRMARGAQPAQSPPVSEVSPEPGSAEVGSSERRS